MQSQGQGREVVPDAVEQGGQRRRELSPDLSTIKLIDYDFKKYGSSDERKRLLQKWDDGGLDRCRSRPMRAPQASRAASHPTVVLWLAVGLGRLRRAALVRAGRAISSRCRWLLDGYPLDDDVAPALFLVLQGQKLWLAPLGLLLLAAAAAVAPAEDPIRCSAAC